MTDAAVPPRVTATPVPTTAPAPVMPSTSAEVADLFDVLAASAHWPDSEHQDALFPVESSPVESSPVERGLADTIAADARAQLARLDPPVLLSGVAVWLARHPATAEAVQSAVAGRVDFFWPSEAGA
jgi:hypothetical protein